MASGPRHVRAPSMGFVGVAGSCSRRVWLCRVYAYVQVCFKCYDRGPQMPGRDRELTGVFRGFRAEFASKRDSRARQAVHTVRAFCAGWEAVGSVTAACVRSACVPLSPVLFGVECSALIVSPGVCGRVHVHSC